ncbi:hypothetical protein DEO72_LG10g2295 [Vigna unguiculata]|uniref:Uncharacterized protein n=1 Tax=Vigna unguiculata TaxID=3917 RepID=A0A4D6NDT7_VIGUN|nr:hypothetical protein DEO72_LG10g2295 [Vigna unguiculata]
MCHLAARDVPPGGSSSGTHKPVQNEVSLKRKEVIKATIISIGTRVSGPFGGETNEHLWGARNKLGVFELSFWKFPETAWRAVHSRQASHALWLIFGFLKRNRLAINSRPPGNTYQFYLIFCVFMKGLAVVIDPSGDSQNLVELRVVVSGLRFACAKKNVGVEKPWGLSSPYLLVFGDDRVMRYTRADDVAGGANEA